MIYNIKIRFFFRIDNLQIMVAFYLWPNQPKSSEISEIREKRDWLIYFLNLFYLLIYSLLTLSTYSLFLVRYRFKFFSSSFLNLRIEHNLLFLKVEEESKNKMRTTFFSSKFLKQIKNSKKKFTDLLVNIHNMSSNIE
ncbi:hypothetical protein BpHYR1_019349 [Brachionus plicatilis]|uniref:Transmembrane protein n=1 Tax=Brachionus plicatilis TaxID=10195 RepID=A0A3M7P4F0_BRAPC|nr:hypothetical protein BpHYR1_019349 [Brachionus plicatilis]